MNTVVVRLLGILACLALLASCETSNAQSTPAKAPARNAVKVTDPALPPVASATVPSPAGTPRTAEAWAARGEALARDVADPKHRVAAIKSAAVTLMDMGRPGRAETLLAPLEEGDRRNLYSILMCSYADIGDLPRARAIAKRWLAGSASERGEALIAIRRAQAGDVATAREIAATLRDPEQKDNVNRWLAEALARQGDLDGADKVVEQIGAQNQQAAAREAVTYIRIQRLNFTTAPGPAHEAADPLSSWLKLPTSFVGRPTCSAELERAAQAWGRGDRKEFATVLADAVTIAQKSEAGLVRATNFGFIALAQAVGGDRPGVRKSVRQALQADGTELERAFIGMVRPLLVTALVDVGEVKEGLDLACHPDGESLPDAGSLQAAGSAVAQTGGWAEMEKWVESLPEPAERSAFCLGVASWLHSQERTAATTRPAPARE